MIIKQNFFDIETTGLAADDEIICFSYGGVQKIQTKKVSERDLLIELNELVGKMKQNPLVTFFGEPKYGTTQGFDLPMIRTRYILNDIANKYPFRGMHHIDVLDVVKKYFNTKTLQEPKVELLSASQVAALVREYDHTPAKTKEANIRSLAQFTVPSDIEEYVRQNVELKTVDNNSLDHAFKLFFPNADKSILNEEFDGEDMPRLFSAYTVTGDPENLNKILEHNHNCIEKLMHVYDVCIDSGMVNSLQVPQTRL